MLSKRTLLINLGIAVLATSLVACDSAEQRKVKYKTEGKGYMEAGEYDKATLAFKNVQQIDPKDWENHYLIGELLSKQGKMEAAFREYNLVVAQDENNVMAKVRVGQLFLLGRDADQAEKFANEALAKQPENIEALVLRAGIQSSRNDNDTAISTIEKALQVSPNDVSASLMLSSIYTKLNKPELAIATLEAAIGQHPDNIPLLTMLGGIYTRNHQMVEAEETLQAIIKAKPNDYQHYKTLALFLVAEKQDDKAEAVLRDAVKKLPDSDVAKTTLVEFLVEKRSPDQAIAELLPMIASNPNAYELKFKLAGLYVLKKDLTNAESALKEVVDQDKHGPNSIKARDKLANLYMLTNRLDESRALIKEVLEANPGDAEALTLRGSFALNDNRIPEAIADFRTVLVDQPKNLHVLKLLATAHTRNNELPLAIENFEKIVTAAPTDEASRIDLASLLLKIGQKEQARQQVENLLKQNPKSLKGLEAMFRIDLFEKQWGKAQEIARTVQQLNPKDPTGYYMSGLGFKAENKLEASIDPLQQAMLKQPDAIEPLNELIKSYMGLKQSAKALEQLQQIVKQQPNNVVAYNLIGGVYLELKKLPEAKAAFQKTVEIKPEWFIPYRNLALIALSQKNTAEAIGVLTDGISKTHYEYDLVIDLARIYHNNGEHGKVIELYDACVNANPKSARFANDLASYLSDYFRSPDDLVRAAKLVEPFQNTTDLALQDTLGWIAYKQENYEKAKTILTKVLEAQPTAFISQYHLGMTYYKLKDNAKAEEYLKQVVDKKVEFDNLEAAKDVLKKIQAGG